MPTSRLIIDIKTQILHLMHDAQTIASYSISTSNKGVGEIEGSFMTPRGRHRICAKIGADLPLGAVLVGREWTGEVYDEALAARHPERDWILTRILWLSGMQPYVNYSGVVDTQQRYIYLHGCPDTAPMGEPHSIGCIRMRNKDMIQLFEQVLSDTEVVIVEDMMLPPLQNRVLREIDQKALVMLEMKKIDQLPLYTTNRAIKSEAECFYVIWDHWGETAAFCRLRLEGVVDNVCLRDFSLLPDLMNAVLTRALALGWLELRVMVKVAQLNHFTALNFQAIGDLFEMGNERYQTCRLFISHDD